MPHAAQLTDRPTCLLPTDTVDRVERPFVRPDIAAIRINAIPIAIAEGNLPSINAVFPERQQ